MHIRIKEAREKPLLRNVSRFGLALGWLAWQYATARSDEKGDICRSEEAFVMHQLQWTTGSLLLRVVIDMKSYAQYCVVCTVDRCNYVHVCTYVPLRWIRLNSLHDVHGNYRVIMFLTNKCGKWHRYMPVAPCSCLMRA